MLTLCYTALSPFCRKVRMAMEYKGLEFKIAPSDRIASIPAWNPRAEVPVLIDGDRTVCNSADILGYIDRRFAERPLYPAAAGAYADMRDFERWSDTHVDAILTVIGNWQFADLPPMPQGLLDAARRDMGIVYDRLQAQLTGKDHVCGEIGAADFALYPQIASGAIMGLPFDGARHPDVRRWLRTMRERPEGQTDLAAARDWWANRESQEVDTERVNWGTFRLEWLLANGQAEWFAEQVRQEKVLWSVGPKNHALKHPKAPDWAKRAAG